MVSQRTLVALQFPPHVVALACVYLAALLSTFEQNDANAPPESQNNLKIVATLSDHGPWEKKFQAQVDDLEGEPLATLIVCARLTILLLAFLPHCANPLTTHFSYFTCASRSAYIADTEPLCQHNPKHTIVPIPSRFASRNAYCYDGTTHL